MFVSTTLGIKHTLVRNRYQVPLEEIDLQLPEGLFGDAQLELEVRDTFGVVQARAQTTVNITGSGRYDVDVPLVAEPTPAVLYRDAFDDGDYRTNRAPGGIGSGFHLLDLPDGTFSDVLATEAGDRLILDGQSVLKQLTSNDAIDPTGTTLTWVVTRRPSGLATAAGVNAIAVGWTRAGEILCCGIDTSVVLTDDRMVYDILPTTTFQPNYRYINIALGSELENATYDNIMHSDLIISLYLDRTHWKVDVLSPGIEVHQQGGYRPGVSLDDVLAKTGGTMQLAAAIGRQGATGVLDSVIVTRP